MVETAIAARRSRLSRLLVRFQDYRQPIFAIAVALMFVTIIILIGAPSLEVFNFEIMLENVPRSVAIYPLIAALLLFALFTTIPTSSENLGHKITGRLVPGPFPDAELRDKNFKIVITPNDAKHETAVKGNGDFVFPATDRLQDGRYKMALVADGNTVAEMELVLEEDIDVTISRGDAGSFEAEYKKPLDVLEKKFSSGIGKNMVQAIEGLGVIAQEDESIRGKYANLLQSEDDDEGKWKLAVFVLGHVGDRLAIEPLQRVMEDDSAPVYYRLRAARYLMNFPETRTQARKFLIDNLRASAKKDPLPHVIAAIHLAMCNEYNQEVIRGLIDGLKARAHPINDPQVRAYIQSILARIAGEDLGGNPKAWESWQAENPRGFAASAEV